MNEHDSLRQFPVFCPNGLATAMTFRNRGEGQFVIFERGLCGTSLARSKTSQRADRGIDDYARQCQGPKQESEIEPQIQIQTKPVVDWTCVDSCRLTVSHQKRERMKQHMVDRALYSSSSDEYGTPQWLFDALNAEFGFSLDPCCTHARMTTPSAESTTPSAPFPSAIVILRPVGFSLEAFSDKASDSNDLRR